MYEIVTYNQEILQCINNFIEKFSTNVMQTTNVDKLTEPLLLGSFIPPDQHQTLDTLIKYPQNLKLNCEIKTNKNGHLVLKIKTDQWLKNCVIKEGEKELLKLGKMVSIPESKCISESFTLNPLNISIERNKVQFYSLNIQVGKTKGAIPRVVVTLLQSVDENTTRKLERLTETPFRKRDSTIPTETDWDSLKNIREHLMKGTKNFKELTLGDIRMKISKSPLTGIRHQFEALKADKTKLLNDHPLQYANSLLNLIQVSLEELAKPVEQTEKGQDSVEEEISYTKLALQQPIQDIIPKLQNKFEFMFTPSECEEDADQFQRMLDGAINSLILHRIAQNEPSNYLMRDPYHKEFLKGLKSAIETQNINNLKIESTCFICLQRYPNISSLELHKNMIHKDVHREIQYYIKECFSSKFMQLANLQSAYLHNALPSICATQHTIITPMLMRMSLPLCSLKTMIYNFYEAMTDMPTKTSIITNDQLNKVNDTIMSFENKIIGMASETCTNSSKIMGNGSTELEGLLNIINLVLLNYEAPIEQKLDVNIFCPKFPTMTTTTNKSNSTLKIINRKLLERQSNEGEKVGIYRDLEETVGEINEGKILYEKSLQELPFLIRSDTPTSQIILQKFNKLWVTNLEAKEMRDEEKTIEREEREDFNDPDTPKLTLPSSLVIRTRNTATPSNNLRVAAPLEGVTAITDIEK